MLVRTIRFLMTTTFVLTAGYVFGQSIQAVDTGLGGQNSITGTVLTPSGQRTQGRVSVRLATMHRGDRVTVTDDSGNFGFKGLINGDYTLVVDRELEYEMFSQNVNVFQMRGMPGQNILVSIRLKAKPGRLAKPAVVNADLAGVPQKAIELFNAGVELAKTGDRNGAVERLRSAVVEHPGFMLAHNEIGVQYMKMNDLAKADIALQEALKIQPEAYTPLVNRGIVLYTLKRYADAEPGLRAAVKVNKDGAVGHYFLGQTLAHLGNFDEAERELQTAVSLGGAELREAHRLLAIIYSSKGEKKRAAKELEIYLTLHPKAPDAEQLKKVIQQLKSPTAQTTPQ